MAGIRAYWIVNLIHAAIEVYRDPQSDGRYATVTTARSGDTLTVKEIDGLSINVNEILGLTSSSYES